MVDGIRQGANLGGDALEAALAAHARIAQKIESQVAASFGAPSEAQRATGANEFAAKLAQGVQEADQAVRGIDQLAPDLVSGSIKDFHEVAVAIKSSELTFKFALEVRNKLIEAYRETMRMNV